MNGRLTAEALKLTTVRGAFVLLFAVLVLAGLAVVATVADPFGAPVDASGLAAAAGAPLVLVALLGVLLVTTEYRHGTIVRTFLVAPARERVLATKLAVGALGGVLFGLAAVALALVVAVPWLHARGEPLALDVSLAEALGRLLLAFALVSALGVGFGALVRSQVAAIVGVFAWFFIVEPMLNVLPLLALSEETVERFARFLPAAALGALAGDSPSLSFAPALGVSLAWVTGVALAALLSLRRDVA